MVVYRFERGAKIQSDFCPMLIFFFLSSWFDRDIGDNTFKLLVNF